MAAYPEFPVVRMSYIFFVCFNLDGALALWLVQKWVFIYGLPPPHYLILRNPFSMLGACFLICKTRSYIPGSLPALIFRDSNVHPQ